MQCEGEEIKIRIKSRKESAATELNAVGFAVQLGADGDDAIFDEAFDLVNGFTRRITGRIFAHGNVESFKAVIGFGSDGGTDDRCEGIDLREEAFLSEEIVEGVFEFSFVDVAESRNGHGAFEETEVVGIRFPDAGL